MDTMKWAIENFSDSELGDARRTARLVQMASMVTMSPEESLSSMLGSQADNKAAQRFFKNEDIEYEDLIQSSIDQTLVKIQRQKSRVLLIQDTCHLNYDSKTSIVGLGHIGSTKDKSFQGVMMHWCLAVSQTGESLGVAHLKLWERKKNPRKTKVNEHQNKPIEAKESYKWIEAVNFLDGQLPPESDVVWVADREADIYEFIDSVSTRGQSFVIRANGDRVIADEESLLKERVRTSSVLGVQTLEKPNCDGAIERIDVEIRCVEVGLLAQRRKGGAKSSHKSKDHELYAVHVSAKDPKLNFEWILLTNLRAETLEECLEVIWIYRQRWHIECVHKTLKSGFQGEKLSLNHVEKIEKAIAFFLPCAVQIYWLSQQNKKNPDSPADAILSTTECTLLCLKNKKPKGYVPTIKEAWLWIGYMGGFRGSKNSKPPGQITFWRGFRKLKSMAQGADIMREALK